MSDVGAVYCTVLSLTLAVFFVYCNAIEGSDTRDRVKPKREERGEEFSYRAPARVSRALGLAVKSRYRKAVR